MVDLERDVLVNKSTGKEYKLQPLGDAGAWWMCLCLSWDSVGLG